MARFICAVSETDGRAAVAALVETTAAPDGAQYAVRALKPLGDDPVSTLETLLASEEQYVGQTTVVAAGGQPGADRFADAGLSAYAVSVTDGDAPGSADATAVPAQVLVDTFTKLYRAGAVSMPGTLDGATDALHAMYSATDLEAASDERDPVEAEPLGANPGPTASRVEQSGSAASVSTAVVPDDMVDRPGSTEGGRIATPTGARVDLGEHRDTALALGLACWYGEYSAGHLGDTDKADGD